MNKRVSGHSYAGHVCTCMKREGRSEVLVRGRGGGREGGREEGEGEWCRRENLTQVLRGKNKDRNTEQEEQINNNACVFFRMGRSDWENS